jgi:hypothetical protein
MLEFADKATSPSEEVPQEVAGNPAGSRQSPQDDGREALLSPGIPAYPAQPGSAMSGLSRRRSRVRVPSLPLSTCTSALFVANAGAIDRRLRCIPRRSRARISPAISARCRSKPGTPATERAGTLGQRSVGHTDPRAACLQMSRVHFSTGTAPASVPRGSRVVVLARLIELLTPFYAERAGHCCILGSCVGSAYLGGQP